MIRTTLASIALALALPAAHAAVVFQDGFETTTPGSNVPPAGWTVTDGSVEVLGSGFFGNLCRPGTQCVDLDGSSNQAGRLGFSLDLTAGTYLLSYGLAGSQRGDTNTVNISLDGFSIDRVLASGDAYAVFQDIVTIGADGTYRIAFRNGGGDNLGALLDDVRLETVEGSEVPVPGALALMGAGLLGLGASMRRRR